MHEPPVQVFVAPRQLRPRGGVLLSLARAYHLDVWGGSLLGERAAEQMGTAALLLTVVSLFETIMWSFLFNTVAYHSPWATGVMTFPAVLFGLLFAVGIFVYEKSLVTADFVSSSPGVLRYGSGGPYNPTWFRRHVLKPGLGAFVLRVVLILLSAFATAQPFELMLFNGAIEQRLRDETANAEALRQTGLQARDATGAGRPSLSAAETELKGTRVESELAVAETDVRSADATKMSAGRALDETQRALAGACARVEYWQNEVQRRKALPADTPDVPSVSEAEAELNRARMLAAVTRQREIQANAAVQQATLVVAESQRRLLDKDREWKQTRDAQYEGLKSEAKMHEQQMIQRKAWLDQIQVNPYGSQITNPLTKSELRWNVADVTDRLCVLEDLIAGRPARWPLSSAEARREAIKIFQLPDTQAPETESRVKATVMFRMYLIGYVIAFSIPLMAVGFKFWLSGPELATYYSLACQARAGCQEALEIQRARYVQPFA